MNLTEQGLKIVICLTIVKTNSTCPTANLIHPTEGLVFSQPCSKGKVK